MTSTCDFRGDRKSTASSVGTSTPSLRQRAFVRMRHTGTSSVPAPSVSQSISRARTAAFIVPSTWRHSTCRLSDASSLLRSLRPKGPFTRSGNCVATAFEALMSLQKATARRIGARSSP